AVIAGSALTVSTVAFGAPAALADTDQQPQQAAETQATDRDNSTQENQLDVTPDTNKARPGDTFTVSGSGFTPHGDVQLTMGNELVVQEQADEHGDFIAEVEIHEEFEAGSYDLAVSDGQTGNVTYTDFTVLNHKEHEDDDDDDREVDPDVELVSDEVAPGEPLRVSGEDFTRDGVVSLRWNPEQSIAADERGNISTEFFVPENAEEGSYELVVTDKATGEQETEEFTVEVDDQRDGNDRDDD
ncbi:MAG: hypothetical protein ACTH1B_07785, partial [Yaniella sp.]